MTVTSTNTDITVSGTGAATSFSFSPLILFADADLVVYKIASDGVTATLLAKGASATTYSIQPTTAYPSSGSITYPAVGGTPLASNEQLYMYLATPNTQGVHLENQGGYFADVQEQAFDRLTILVQNLKGIVSRCVQGPIWPKANYVMPAAKAGYCIGFDNSTPPNLTTILPGATGATGATGPTGPQGPPGSGSGDMLKANNLSDLVSASTARTNLGLATGATTTVGTIATLTSITADQQAGAIVSVTDQANLVFDQSLGRNYKVTLGGNRTLNFPTNPAAGQSGVWTFTQDGTGSRTLTLAAGFKTPGGAGITLSTAAGAIDTVSYYMPTAALCYLSLLKAFA